MKRVYKPLVMQGIGNIGVNVF